MPTLTTSNVDINYRDSGPRGGHAVLLIHGWPDDASTWDEVTLQLNEAGLRTIVSTLRGFGETRVHEGAGRTGNSAVLAMDMIALMDGLNVEGFMVAGHDWGSNTAEAMAVGWPDRVERMAMLATPSRLGGMPTPPFGQAQLDWYHWFMATARGAVAVADDRRSFAHIHWVNWSPPGWFAETTFDRVAHSFKNPDWVDVTLHSYRARWDEAKPDPDSQWLEDKFKATSTLSLPTMYFQGAVGRWMNHNFAKYHAPANADIDVIEVIFVDEPDPEVTPLGVKGLGEIGIVGTAAAVANAIYHATGKRVRSLPITIDKLL
ncbi:MAG: alpha/beta hydrolase [Sphingomonadales bacterium]|nr:alpha/beta hydrolase [Sphingomonadales bacterium]